MGAVRLDSKALRGPGGAAVAAVPSLLSGALAEGAAGLIEEPLGGDDGSGAAASARRAPCCQCLAAVLNKLADGAEADSAVGLVVTALTEAFSGEGEAAMDVDGAAAAGEGPVQCLAWTLKAVAMRGGNGDAFSELLGLLCGLLTAGPSRAGGDTPSRRALAAAAAFGVTLGDDGEVLRADADGGGGDGGGGDGGGGARVSPLWRQRFFVQTFPKLLTAARGPARTRTGSDEDNGSSCEEDMAEQQAPATDATPAAATAGGGSAGLRVPALLALMRLVRGVPLEAISQQQHQRDTAVSAVVQALRSDYQPLQAEALETFQVLSRDDLTAFNQHLSSVIPLLLSLAEARNGSRTKSTGGPVNHSDAQGPGVDGSLRGGRSGPMERFRAVRCLTALTALPYSRLHPFKTQVTRRLRGPLDDDRRAIRQAAAEARNIWFLLG
ncbi:unnamed protein product [Ectocarpus sp. CCAP 1310/34]|nr:unnamed protein product [Ectocarpus sp. CCAP 1310/34]